MRLEQEHALEAAYKTEEIRKSVMKYTPNILREAMAEDGHMKLVDESDQTPQPTELETIPQAS